MGAIYRRELRSAFTGMTGAIAAAVMLLVGGLMFRYYNLYNGVLTLHYAVSNATLMFYIVVPILSMRTFSEERKQKTDQLLLTSPVGITEIVLGKYLALITILALPTAVFCFYPLIMLSFGAETLLWDYICIMLFYLMGCAYLAVGMFISTCTESMVIAAILSILFVFVTQMLSSAFTIIGSSAFSSLLFLIVLALLAGLLCLYMTRHYYLSLGLFAALAVTFSVLYLVRQDWFSGRSESLLRVLDFSTHFTAACAGSVSISNLLFFVSYIVIGVVLTVQSVAGRRWN